MVAAVLTCAGNDVPLRRPLRTHLDICRLQQLLVGAPRTPYRCLRNKSPANSYMQLSFGAHGFGWICILQTPASLCACTVHIRLAEREPKMCVVRYATHNGHALLLKPNTHTLAFRMEAPKCRTEEAPLGHRRIDGD